MLPSNDTPFREYNGDGRCIFCLMPYPPEGLTLEHIIPRGLNGTWHFRKASCRACQSHCNHTFENPALNADLYVPRLLLGLRRRSKDPRYLPKVAFGDHTLTADDEVFIHQLATGNYPPAFHINMLEPAGRLVGIERGGDLPGVRLALCTLDPRKRVFGATTRHRFDHTAFALTLGKIGYCFACAHWGLDGFNGLEMRQLLCGERQDAYNFVGGTIECGTPFTKRWLHNLYVREREELATVIVHLFASFGLPPYEVVVGNLK